MTRALIVLGLVALNSGALAHSGATGVVKERMDAMKEMKDATKALAAMAKGEAPFTAPEAVRQAERVAALSAEIPELFPDGSATGKSEALPEIWSRWSDFTSGAEAAAAKARAVAQAAGEGRGAFAGAVAAMAGTCKDCHDTFKRED